MNEETPKQAMKTTTEKKYPASNNKNEIILYRLDNIDQQLSDVKTLLVQTSLQDQRIHALEVSAQEQAKDKETLILLKQTVDGILSAQKKSSDKWWQILLMILSPLASALMVWILTGGLK